jgi:hypothetical protein
MMSFCPFYNLDILKFPNFTKARLGKGAMVSLKLFASEFSQIKIFPLYNRGGELVQSTLYTYMKL